MSGKIFITDDYFSDVFENEEEVVFGKAEELSERNPQRDRRNRIVKMLSNIVVVKGEYPSLSKYYKVYSFNPQREDFENVVKFLRDKIKTGELTPDDEIRWNGHFNKKVLKELIGGNEGDYLFNVDEEENVLFGNVEDLPEGLRKYYNMPYYWKKLNTTLALTEGKCIDEKTSEITKCFNIITKKRVKTKELKDLVNVLEKNNIEKAKVFRAKSEKDILEEKLIQ